MVKLKKSKIAHLSELKEHALKSYERTLNAFYKGSVDKCVMITSIDTLQDVEQKIWTHKFEEMQIESDLYDQKMQKMNS